MDARKTSRKPVQVGKWTPRARRAKKLHTSLRRSSKTRKGRLSFRHVEAKEYKGGDPAFKGRIVLNRQAGFLEFPNFSQFRRIAQQEKVPKQDVDTAFGHMQPRRKTSRRPRRRTSRIKKNSARRKRVRRDDVFVPSTRRGESTPFVARTVLIPQSEVGRFGAERGVWMDLGGAVTVLPYERAMMLAEPWLTKKEFHKAFGHIRMKGVLGKTERRRPIPLHYGPRSMRLGHRNPPGEGPAIPGIAKGQLVLYHKPTGSIVWQAYDDEVNYPDKPIWIWFGARKSHVSFPKAMQGARTGQGDRSAMIGADDRGIPPMAMLQAFDHLLTPAQRREAYEVFSAL